MTATDEDLANAAAQGDRDAFALLAERSYDRIFRLSFRLTGNRAEAEDLTQDICLSLPARLATWRGQARFTTWLYRVVVNAAHDRRRRHASHARAATGWGDYEQTRQAERTEIADARDWLATAMTTLPPDLRDTVVLVVSEEMSHADAAEILDISEGTVSWRMSQARKHLRALAQREETP